MIFLFCIPFLWVKSFQSLEMSSMDCCMELFKTFLTVSTIAKTGSFLE